MKNSVLFLIVFFAAPIFSVGQGKKQLSQLFYSLPIDQSRKVIIRNINKEPGFVKLNRNDSFDFGASYTDSYYGKIARINMPAQYSMPESATIEVAWETGLYIRKGKEFGTDISIIKIEYFFMDRQSADAYYTYAWDQIKNLSGDSSSVTIASNSNVNFYTGKKLVLKGKHKRYLSNINLLKSDVEKNERYSIVLEYRREGN